MTEEMKEVPCKVEGILPEWLQGTLFRNGPAKFQAGGKAVSSWFDGLAMIHAFDISNTKVTYTNRFLRTDQYESMVNKNKLDFTGFAQDPCSSRFKKFFSLFFPKKSTLPNACVSIAEYGNKMVGLTETPLPVVFDQKTLETLGGFGYQDTLPKSDIFESAHPQFDPEKEAIINYLVDFGRKSKYVIWQLKNASRAPLAEVPVEYPAYMHSFALTENHVILVEFPFIVKPLDLLLENKAFIRNYKWKPERGTNFLVIRRSDGQVVTSMKTPAFFAFHHVNAFEKGNDLIIDIITYPDARVIEMVSHDTMEAKHFPKTSLERFTLSLTENQITSQQLFDEPLELPKVSPGFVAKPYRYCYAIDGKFPTTLEEELGLYKVDVETKKGLKWSQKGCYAGEPIFVAKPNSQAEDDGVVLSLVLDLVKHTSFLLVLDATNMTEMARAYAPCPIPVGLHGLWKNQ